MNVLVVGSGGREHALVWKISKSPRVERLLCAPGNAGIAQQAECVNVSAEDLSGLVELARTENVDLTVVGPEAPLTAGIGDRFEAEGLRVFGPSQAAAEIEGSKVFCKQLLARHGIPTAEYQVFNEPAAALAALPDGPVVVKADGLAAGKGVLVCDNRQESEAAIRQIMVDRAFGMAGDRAIVEERLTGQECSLLAFTDGETVVPMVPAQDYKRVLDNDEGLNTGGMGCYSPVPALTPQLHDQVLEEILKPTVAAMAAEGRPYKGALYAGLMLTQRGPEVLEYNCRFGDPETQVILPRLESDLVDILEAVIDGTLATTPVRWSEDHAVCVVLASGGYPGSYEKGKPVFGLNEAAALGNVVVFHAGTALKDGTVVTSGGRVLGVTAVGQGFASARNRAYEAVARISFGKAHYRRDISARVVGED